MSTKDMSTKEQETIPIESSKVAWVVYVNSDLTEGRGFQYPIGICESQTTGIRIGRKQDVQGCDAIPVEKPIFRIHGEWYGPVRIQSASREDEATDKKLAARRAAIERARNAGLTEQDIRDLYQQITIP